MPGNAARRSTARRSTTLARRVPGAPECLDQFAIEPDQLGIDRQRRTKPGFPNLDLQLSEPGVVAGRGVRSFERHGVILGQAWGAHVGDPDLLGCRGTGRARTCPTARWTNLLPSASAVPMRS